jgi:hypothetical protein
MNTLQSVIDKIAADIILDKAAVSPKNWSGTTKAMKRHKNISNPFALSWWMTKQKPGAKWGPGGKLKKSPQPHYKPEKKKKSDSESTDKIAQIADDIIADIMISPAMPDVPISESSKKYSTIDSVKTDNGYITIKTNYDEKDGEVILEEYVVDKDGDVKTYNNTEDFTNRLVCEGLL